MLNLTGGGWRVNSFFIKNAVFCNNTIHNGCLMEELAVEPLGDKRSDFGDKRLMLANAACGCPA
jgi:hypothetical protein